MRRRRREDDASQGAPAWIATFGDMMSLLLCFFVLLFSMSSVDTEKYKLVVASFSKTSGIFDGGAPGVSEGVLISNGVSQLNELENYMYTTGKASETDEEPVDILAEAEAKKLQKSEEMSEEVKTKLEEVDLTGQLDVAFTSDYVSLTFNGAFLFDSGEAALREEAYPTLDKIAAILETYSDCLIEIEGHTDNMPIRNSKYTNNNELSSFRALSVFDYFLEHSTLDPAMIKHSGRGEYVPVADNSTEEGRAKNRRVEIKIYNPYSY